MYLHAACVAIIFKVESLESDLELSKNTRSSKDSEHVDKLKEVRR